MKKSRFTDRQIIAVRKEAVAGTPVPELCRSHGISSATSYKWRSKFGGMDVSLMTRMKEREEENRRLKKLYVDAQLSADLLRESLAKRMVRPAQRRALAQHTVQTKRTTIQHACRTYGISETCYRHQGRRVDEDAEVADWLVRLTTTYRTWGFGLCFLHLRNVKQCTWNHVRVYRVSRTLALNLRIKPRPRLVRETPQPLAVPDAPNAVWSMDFMHDPLADGRSFGCSTSWMTSIAKD